METHKFNVKKLISVAIICVAIPLAIVAAMLLLNGEYYNILSILIAALSLVPFFLLFEKKSSKAREVVIIAVMIALSVVSRLVFYVVPAFKPVTAIVIIVGLCIGSEAGFLTGSMSALVSNMFFGQGAWTPFQMFTWGLLGFICGVFANAPFMKSKVGLIILGILGGVAFSLIMDTFTVLNFHNGFDINMYLKIIVTSLPFMAIYAVSNIIFLFLLFKPLSQKLMRMRRKFGVFKGMSVIASKPIKIDVYTEEELTALLNAAETSQAASV